MPSSPSESRRDKYTEATRQALLHSARRSFGSAGYAASSLEDIARQENLTKGAVYHHFKNKEIIFEAVINDVLTEAMQTVSDAVAGIDDPRQQALLAIDSFLDICLQAEYQQIVLRDGPSVLGWARWRELEKHYSYPLIEGLLMRLKENQLIEDRPVNMLARMIVAWIIEVAFMLTETQDQAQTREQSKLFLADLLKLKPD